MGEIVTAFGVCHSPHLLTRPPDEVPDQSEASIAAMRELGRLLDETQPDVVLFLGPMARYIDNVPQSALDKVEGTAPQFFYFQYRPFYRRTATFPDIISVVLRRLRGKTLLIHSPNEFAKAIQEIERRTQPGK